MKMMMMIVLLLLISQHASGVEVYEGEESVLLPCQVPADVSRSSTAAVWDRDGLKNPTVHLRRQKSDDLSGQNDFYKHRTSMRADALQTGDLSLTLRNPTVSDSGTYTCTSRKAGEDLSKTVVQLKVTVPPPPPPFWPKVLAAVLVTLIILAAAIGLFMYRAYKRKKDREALLPEVVEKPQGEKSVQLPFKTTAGLREAFRVEWTLTEPKHMMIHRYERVKSLPDIQDQGYRCRTEMDEDPLGTKDLSLTLKHLRLTDSGVYTCTVYNKLGAILLQKSVTLSVRVPPPEVVNVTDADESVLLPFTTTADLPQDVTAEWTHKHMKVHVYDSGNNQPDKQDQVYIGRTEMKEDPLTTKDFSLTLKQPQTFHTGVYTCTVSNKDGKQLLQKVVSLNVRESLPDIVQEQKGLESVVLPFKPTADLPQDVTVGWTLTEPKHMMVHVYKSGNNQPDEQDQDYRGRTEMTEDPLRNKDLSLTLKHLRLTDSGVYTCTVYDKGEYTLLQKSVTLNVYDKEPERIVTVCGDKSLMLQFKITDELPVITTVEWKLIYPKYNLIQKKYVHMANEGDLSLTLKDPHPTDSGYYTCTVCNNNGNMLLQKSLLLSVIDFQVEVVEVTEGEESVLLPFKTTADLRLVSRVEWRLTEPKSTMVHGYEYGKDKPPLQQPYIGRTEMNKDPLRTGDLSLTLKRLNLANSETYICTVYNKYTDKLLQKVVILRVRATLKGTIEDMLPCLRRRRTAPKPEVKEEVRNMNHEEEPLTAEERV